MKMNKNILIVDDDSDMVELICLILEEEGYNTWTLTSGEVIEKTMQTFKPDLILMDVMLADLDGRELCRKLKESADTNHIPVILISGSHELNLPDEGLGAPDGFIHKPFDINTLVQKVGNRLAA
ncbi:response regulator [Mucilaginibacter flavus]|uniref:response regulator n=1 Tax=Mucilaginibacter flavus TaxID=931504 RepID=UPI0025B5AB48|nr:response regulator [Mucilaginibacter flavus]